VNRENARLVALFSGLQHTDIATFLVTNSEQKKGFSNFPDRKKLMKISRSEFSNKEKNHRETYPVGSWISPYAPQHFGGSNPSAC
jgi:hypothetical protein